MAQPPKTARHFTFAHEKIACGKTSCRTCGGSSFEHGPYWYGYYSHPNGSTGKVYIGKNLSELVFPRKNGQLPRSGMVVSLGMG